MKKFFKRPEIVLGYLFALFATAIWSGNFVIARGLSDKISPVNLAFFRWAAAVVFFCPFALKPLIRDFYFVKKNFLYLLVTSILGITVFNTLIYYAGHTTTAVNLSLIAITFPVFTIGISRVFFKEKITFNKTIGIILVGLGVVNLITKGNFSDLKDLSFSKGDILMLFASMIFAVFSTLLKKKPEKMNLFAFQFSTFLMGLIFLLPFFIFENIGQSDLAFSREMILSVLYLGIFASLTAFVLWNKAILILGPPKAVMIYYLLPLFSAVSAGIFLNEKIGAVHFLSLFLIVPGIIIANYDFKKIKSPVVLKDAA